ncbi:MAG: HAMP domain-containing histidine kinase [Candidatus Obscuribacterales bacterium]|nr:HAMP domain-containing histidine kinase [Candidatus Obscuribacterales bacterium]
MKIKGTLFGKGLLLVLCPLILGAMFSACLLFSLNQSSNAIREEARLLSVITYSSRLFEFSTKSAILANEISTDTRAGKEPSPETERSLYEVLDSYGDTKKRIAAFWKNREADYPYWTAVDEATRHGVELMKIRIEPGARGLEILNQRDDCAKALAGAVRQLSYALEKQAKNARENRMRESHLVIFGLTVSLMLVLVITGFIMAIVGFSILKRAEQLVGNVSRFSSGQEMLPQLAATDEIADLDSALRATARRLQQAREGERLYFEIVCDGIRQPLDQLSTDIERLPQFSGMEKYQKQLHILSVNLKQLIDLQSDLELTRQMRSVDGMELSLETCLIPELLVKIDTTVQPVATDKNIVLEIENHCGDLNRVLDESNVTRLLVNLLTNAVKFSPDGAKVILRVSGDDKTTLFEVIDFGRGIAPEKLSTIFDAYTQTSKDDAVGNKGFGLGLAVCKQIAEAHGGRIEVESNIDKGSTFRVFL